MCSGTLHESTQYIIIETMTVHYLYHLHRLTVWQSVAIRVRKSEEEINRVFPCFAFA